MRQWKARSWTRRPGNDGDRQSGLRGDVGKWKGEDKQQRKRLRKVRDGGKYAKQRGIARVKRNSDR
jgi:hypothetical protein